MKSMRFRFGGQSITAVVGLVVAGCQSVPDLGTTGPGARVVEVQGRARCSDASQSWRKLSAGESLAISNVVQTALTSSLDFAVSVVDSTEADRILLQSDTTLCIEALPGEAATAAGADSASLKLHLRMGELTFTGPPSGNGSPCEIRFAKGLAAARGATFNLQADGRLKVIRGVVTMKPAADQPGRAIAAGNQYDPATGELRPIPAGDTAAPLAPPPAARPAPPRPWPPWPTRKY